MIDPKTLPEFFVELCTDRETGAFFPLQEHCYASAEELALAVYRVGLPHRLNRRRPQFSFELVVTTHARDATAECNALLSRIYDVAAGLASFGVEYQLLDTLAQNIERLTYCEENGYPRITPGFY